MLIYGGDVTVSNKEWEHLQKILFFRISPNIYLGESRIITNLENEVSFFPMDQLSISRLDLAITRWEPQGLVIEKLIYTKKDNEKAKQKTETWSWDKGEINAYIIAIYRWDGLGILIMAGGNISI